MYVFCLTPPTTLNRFLKSLIFLNLHVPKMVQFYFHKDICIFEAAMASEASGNVCFITASYLAVRGRAITLLPGKWI